MPSWWVHSGEGFSCVQTHFPKYQVDYLGGYQEDEQNPRYSIIRGLSLESDRNKLSMSFLHTLASMYVHEALHQSTHPANCHLQTVRGDLAQSLCDLRKLCSLV